ncbi:MAG: type II TA system antitoxin MqsA family protein [Pseudomonadota bacterium]
MTTGFCPVCEKRTDVKLISKNDFIEVRGEKFEINSKYYKCDSCGESFWGPELGDDPLSLAYDAYRRKNNMLQPEEIKQLRLKYGLTQKEFSRLLGWGDVTIVRYENGSLQDKAHDSMLQLIVDPGNMLKLITNKGDLIPETKRRIIVDNIARCAELFNIRSAICGDDFTNPNIYNGFKRFDPNKLYNVINILCYGADGILKTKLNKLLFYVDFLHYKLFAQSITGANYAKLPFGPVPDNYEHFLRELIGQDIGVQVIEIEYGPYTGEKYFSTRKPDMKMFSANEIETISRVKDFFSTYTATQIKTFSHLEEAYIKTPDSKLISYEYANTLRI